MGEWIFQEQFIDSSHLSESIIWFILKCKISGGVIESRSVSFLQNSRLAVGTGTSLQQQRDYFFTKPAFANLKRKQNSLIVKRYFYLRE